MTDTPSPLSQPIAWDLVSDGYVSEAPPFFEKYSAHALKLAAVKPNERILDVAAGPGTLALLAARQAKVTAVDFSSEMLQRLRSRAAEEALPVDAQLADGTALPFGDGTFDAAFSMFGLIFFPDRARGFAELVRVLRPGGRAVVASWMPMETVPMLAEMFSALRAELPGLPFGQGKAPLGDPTEFAQEMTAAGFHPVSIQQETQSIEAPSMDVLFASMQRSNAPLVLLRQKLGDAQWELLIKAITTRLKAKFGNGKQTVEMTANLALGQRL